MKYPGIAAGLNHFAGGFERRRIVSLLLLVSFLASSGCDREAVPALGREIDNAVRAGLGRLSEPEKERLLKQDLSVLLLLAERSSRKIFEHFAHLPMEHHVALRCARRIVDFIVRKADG